MRLDVRAFLTEWKLAYQRGIAMQATLAVLGFLLGVWAMVLTGKVAFLAGAIVLIANLPWTIFVVSRVNQKLMTTPPENADAETRALIVKWDRLHAVRTVLGALAALAFLLGFMAR